MAETIFHRISTGGCQSYILGCPESGAAVLIDPAQRQIDRYRGMLASDGLRLRYVIDTHTHADHFSATRQISEIFDVPTVMHSDSMTTHAALRVEDGDLLVVGELRLQIMHTPGHTSDSICIAAGNKVFTGDTLLIGGTGRTDLPTGDPEALYDSLFDKLLKLDPETAVYPAHDYQDKVTTTIGHEIEHNRRLQKRERTEFVAMMRELNMSAPNHMTEALRTNLSGGKTVEHLLSEAVSQVPFVSLDELERRIAAGDNALLILDVREKGDFDKGHITGARSMPRGQIELRVNRELPDPTLRIVTVCEFGKISVLAAATLRELGFQRALALDGGMKAWREAGSPIDTTPAEEWVGDYSPAI